MYIPSSKLQFTLFLKSFVLVNSVLNFDNARTNLTVQGTVTLAGLFPVYSYGEEYRVCNHIQPLYVLQVEAFLWAIKKANEHFKKLNFNFSFGAWVKDSCDNGVIGLQQSLTFMKHAMSASDGICQSLVSQADDGLLIGMAGAVTSPVSIRVEPVLEMFCVPLLSSYATSADLSDADVYPYFLRTVPEDIYQSQALFQLLKYQNWTQVAIVYEHTAYGDHFIRHLLQHIKDDNSSSGRKVCVETSIGVVVGDPSWNEVFQKLWEGNARVVVLIFDFSMAKQFFQKIKNRAKKDVHRFQWIGIDGWSRMETVIAGSDDIADRSITVETLSFEVPEFTQHIENVDVPTIKELSNHKLLQKVLEFQENCCFDLTDSECKQENQCTDAMKINAMDAAKGRAHFVIETVKAFRVMFEDLLRKTCPVASMRESCKLNYSSIDGRQMYEKLRQVKFAISGRKFQFCGEHRNNGPPVYSYFQRQKIGSNWVWQPIGEFQNINFPYLVVNESSILKPYPSGEITKSFTTCQPHCTGNNRSVPHHGSCCWHCEACNPSEYIHRCDDGLETCKECKLFQTPDPNDDYRSCMPEKPVHPSLIEFYFKILIFISMAGVGLILIISFIFWTYRSTPLVKLRISKMVAFFNGSTAVIFVLPWLLMLYPAQFACILHWALLGAAYSTVMGCLAVMALRLVNFNEFKIHDHKLFDINWKTMIIQVGLISLGQIGITSIWILIRVRGQEVVIGRLKDSGHSFIMCAELVEGLSFVLFILPAALMIIIPIYLIKRSTPKTLYSVMETRQIIVACTTVFCLFVSITPFAIFSNEYQIKITMHMVAVIAGGYAILFTMQVPNALLILFNSNVNTMAHLAVGRITYNSWRRLKKDDVELETWLGEGHYGEVWKGKLHFPVHALGNKIFKEDVVVKILKEGSDDRKKMEFREEALLMTRFSHENLIHLVGICMTEIPMLLVLEFMDGGSLDKYLQQPGIRNICSMSDLYDILIDIAKACLYLENKGYIHRDIAARNCMIKLVSAESLKPECAKLGDFGLAKDIKSFSGGLKFNEAAAYKISLPIAWTAPEGFAGTFSHKSDIWSYSVLMWEVFSWASTPFGKCSAHRNANIRHICPMQQLRTQEIEEVICVERKVLSDFPYPCFCEFPSAIKDIMKKCWQFNEEDRPSFKQIYKMLTKARNEMEVQTNKFYVETVGVIGNVQEQVPVTTALERYYSHPNGDSNSCILPFVRNPYGTNEIYTD